MFGIDFSENSTWRGAIWLIGGVTGLVFTWFGKDATQVMAVAASVAGGLGFALKD